MAFLHRIVSPLVTRPRVRATGLVALIVLLAAAAGVGAYLGTTAARDAGSAPATSGPATPPGYAAATAQPSGPSSRPGVAPKAAALAHALAPGLAASGLGGRLRASIIDAASGSALYDRGGTAPAAPASTAKLLTAAAVLSVRKPTDRITTSVLAGRAGTVYLVGGGDPTLTAAPVGRSGPYRQAARITDLAAQLKQARTPVRRIVVDDSLFRGPTVSPGWAAEDVPSSYASAITAVLADGGRAAPGDAERSAAPDLAAGRALAAALGRAPPAVSRGTAGRAPGRALATVRSAPIATLVEQMLQTSDNVIAECLARQVALARGEEASFTGAARAVRAALRRVGVDPGAGLVDGSGLAPGDRVSTATLSRLLRAVATDRRGALRSVAAALPVAGWSGSLAGRFVSGSQQSAAGVTRAKTGTLTGVSALAGFVHDRSGRLLVFAFIADRTTSTASAEAALDALVARLANCGCG